MELLKPSDRPSQAPSDKLLGFLGESQILGQRACAVLLLVVTACKHSHAAWVWENAQSGPLSPTLRFLVCLFALIAILSRLLQDGQDRRLT